VSLGNLGPLFTDMLARAFAMTARLVSG
jgi:hypothetical protein